MELRQLEYFQMASRLNNITRAAERLHVSQPNITTAIQKLEHELGVQLFDRSQKQLSLTPEGQVFLNRIEIALQNIQDAVIEVNDYKQLQKGSIKIGIPPMIGSYLFPKIFFNFQRMYPKLEISIFEEGSLAIRKMLENGDLDLGIVIVTNASPTLNVLPLSSNQVLTCLPNNHALANRQTISMVELQAEPLILLKEDSYLRKIVLKEFEQLQIVPRIILSSNQIETIKGLVASGVGLSFLFDVIAQKDPAIQGIPLDNPIFVDIGLAWKKERYLTRASRALIEYIAGFSTTLQKNG
jgi:DNA-binding transcriptional LysR family regulator